MYMTLDVGSSNGKKHLAWKRKRRPHYMLRSQRREREKTIRGSANLERHIFGHLPRQRYLRTFVRWFAQARSRLSLPMRIVKVRKDSIDLAIESYGGCLWARVCSWDTWDWISIGADWKGRNIDLLLDLEAEPRRVQPGYVCGQCDSELADSYPTREALWIGHNFEHFLEFVNERIAPFAVLNLVFDDGFSYAKMGGRALGKEDDCIASVARDGTILFHSLLPVQWRDRW